MSSHLKGGAGVVGRGQNHRAPSSEQACSSALDRAVQIHALRRPFVHLQLLLHEARKLRLSDQPKQSPRAADNQTRHLKHALSTGTAVYSSIAINIPPKQFVVLETTEIHSSAP